MHELSIAQSLVEAIDEQATHYQATRVRNVHLRIGEASGVVVDSLTFCFKMLVDQYPRLTEAQLVIETIPHCAHCSSCQQDFSVMHFVTQCPACSSWATEVISGTELELVDMEIDTVSTDSSDTFDRIST